MSCFPSDLVMSGWSLGVANVYTWPDSDATSNKSWVPVSVDNS